MPIPTFALLALFAAAPAGAHFGVILPDAPVLKESDNRMATLTVGFGHPFEPSGMKRARLRALTVTTPEGSTDLLLALEPADFHGAAGYRLEHEVARPGVQVFHMEPEPYWEPVGDVFIVHYTKAYLSTFGDDTGWDAELGLLIEIVPLSRPIGLWAGNVFQSLVKCDGEPLPWAKVEVKYYAADGTSEAPSELMVSQIRRGALGVFRALAGGGVSQ